MFGLFSILSHGGSAYDPQNIMSKYNDGASFTRQKCERRTRRAIGGRRKNKITHRQVLVHLERQLPVFEAMALTHPHYFDQIGHPLGLQHDK